MLDLLIVLVAVAAGVVGWELGFLARVASWLGLAAGVVLGLLMAPPVARALGEIHTALAVVFAVGVMTAAALLLQAAGRAVGANLRRAVPDGAARRVDQSAGATASVAGVLVLAWLLAPVLAQVPGGMAQLADHSAVLSTIDEVAPAPPEGVAAIQRALDDVPFPEVFEEGASVAAATAPPGLPVPDGVAERTAHSTVQVAAVGCDRRQEGSGFVVAPGLVATNAHVVAGSGEVQVTPPEAGRLDAHVVAFDDDSDLALLHVPELDRPALALTEPVEGAAGAVFGHPGGSEQLRMAPVAIDSRIVAVGRDIYGEDTARRRVLVLGADLAPGDSGGAVVDPEGRVMGVAFAVSPDKPNTAYALEVAELQELLASPRGGPVPTGRCL